MICGDGKMIVLNMIAHGPKARQNVLQLCFSIEYVSTTQQESTAPKNAWKLQLKEPCLQFDIQIQLSRSRNRGELPQSLSVAHIGALGQVS